MNGFWRNREQSRQFVDWFDSIHFHFHPFIHVVSSLYSTVPGTDFQPCKYDWAFCGHNDEYYSDDVYGKPLYLAYFPQESDMVHWQPMECKMWTTVIIDKIVSLSKKISLLFAVSNHSFHRPVQVLVDIGFHVRAQGSCRSVLCWIRLADWLNSRQFGYLI